MPTTVIRRARVWTGDGAHADALVIRDGRIAFAGRERDANLASHAAVLDAGGRLVLPGFVDGHAHLLGTGFAMQIVDLKNTASAEAAAQRVGERAARTERGGWVRGAGWDQNDWPGARFPDRRLLDAAAPEHPVVLTHTSGHCVWANSAALVAAGVTRATAAPAGGVIDRDDNGEPTGVLRDTAARLVTAAAPAPTPPERTSALAAAIEHAHSLGVTGVHAMDVGRGEYQAMLALRDSQRLHLRVHAYLSAERLGEWFDRNVRTGDGGDMMRIGGVKFFADGALGSLTAWMLDPYEDTADVGLPLQPIDELEEKVRSCLEHGLAPAVHAIGDRANREVLDLYERVTDVSPGLPRRIEHAQLLTASDLPRFAAQGIVASMQPIHATQDMRKVDHTWGSRGSGAYAFASLLASGATLAFGSDTPVETMDPLAGVLAAVTRQHADGTPAGGWYPGERISVEAALHAYTKGCARAAGDAGGGALRGGAAGDCVVLSEDLLAMEDAHGIAGARVDATIVAGEVVYERPGHGLRRIQGDD